MRPKGIKKMPAKKEAAPQCWTHREITRQLIADLQGLAFGPPVSHVYNPLVYARRPYDLYLQKYGRPPRNVLLLGMNPGPWGMAQTGVPFGEIDAVRRWMNIYAPVDRPPQPHPRRPVTGFACPRSEISGKRLWGWAQKTFATPERFFARFFVSNYCPLMFIDADGRNRTPNNLRVAERRPLNAVCDRALRRTVGHLHPRYVVGIGKFARQRAEAALAGLDVTIGCITHPSPANPRANRGWESLIEGELTEIGLRF